MPQARLVAHESRVLPHELLQRVRARRAVGRVGFDPSTGSGTERSSGTGELGPTRDRERATLPDARSSAIASPARAPNTAPSSSEFDASRFAPCTPVRATSPTAYRPGKRRASVQIRRHSAHEVVRGRRDGDGLARPVQAALAHGAVDRGEPAREERATLFVRRSKHRRVEEHGSAVLQLHLPRDGPRDDVPRRELAVGVRVEGEAPAVLVDQRGALAADGLGHQERLSDADARVAVPSSTVGWNWKNSRSETSAPARIAAAMPSPVATGGLVVCA